MKLILDINYSEDELHFIKTHDCQIISEFKYPKNAFRKNETPRRMFQYCGTFIAEIWDSDEAAFTWAVMSTRRFRGKYVFSYCCNDLEELIRGL